MTKFRICDQDGQREVSASALLDANRDDEDVCEFVRAAGLGDSARFGGGAAPHVLIERVA